MPEDHYVVHKLDDVGEYKLSYFPHCWSLIISHSVEIVKNLRGRGYGQRQHEERLHVAEHDLSGRYIVCTVNSGNAAEKHILAKNGWKLLDSFFTASPASLSTYDRERVPRPEYVELWGRPLPARGIVSPHLLQTVNFESGEGDR